MKTPSKTTFLFRSCTTICVSVLLFSQFAHAEDDALTALKKKYGGSSQETTATAPKVEPAKVEPAKTEPAKTEPAKQEVKKEEAPAKVETKAETKPEPKAEVKPEPKVEKKEEPKVEKTAEHKSSSKKDEQFKYTLQIASYLTFEEAAERIRTLGGDDYFVTQGQVNGTTRYRVNTGKFKDVKSAKAFVGEKMPEALRANSVVAILSGKERKVVAKPTSAPAGQTEAKPSTAPAPTTAPVEKPKEAATIAPEKAAEEDNYGLLGDWHGYKKKAADKGIDLHLHYKGDYVTNFDGGIEKKSDFLGNVDVQGDFNLEKMLGVRGLSLWLYGMGDHGGHPSKEFIGDTFVASNIEAPNTFKLYEAYLKEKIDDQFTFLLGLRDLNADFYNAESSATFINSAFGCGPTLSQTGLNGPSIFPVTSLAATMKYQSANSFYFQNGAFNALPGDPNDPKGTHVTTKADNGYLLIWETGFAGGKGKGRYKVGVGTWDYSKAQATTDSNKGTGINSGYYAIVDKGITDKLSAFVRYGRANDEINKFSDTTEVGLVYQGLLPRRPDDSFGLGYAYGKVSNDYVLINNSLKEESALEVNYHITVGHGIVLTPDYQFIHNPGLNSNLTDSQVGILRVDIEF